MRRTNLRDWPSPETTGCFLPGSYASCCALGPCKSLLGHLGGPGRHRVSIPAPTRNASCRPPRPRSFAENRSRTRSHPTVSSGLTTTPRRTPFENRFFVSRRYLVEADKVSRAGEPAFDLRSILFILVKS